MMQEQLITYTLHLADTNLIIGQRNAEWCGHGPILEQDIAITNITLDLIGQARSYYQYAASLIGNHATEDSLAYLRNEREYKNLLICEQPNGDWGQTVLRQFLYSSFQYQLLQLLLTHNDQTLAAIAEKSLKEVKYHLRWSSEWVIRLGDGTEESHQRMENAVAELWRYTGEMFMPAAYEKELGIDVASLKYEWSKNVKQVFDEATLSIPSGVWMQEGGKTGTHTEQLGYILTDLQYMQRAYPNSEW
ncbi:MAG TPA: phenylacetate-CoA oxygenase subunit PaaC [Chitinophagaceae bacterium]|nr:phenylacetate-CoA oxygenase subunit PaaC [Chitinophagaceae bacterium]HNA19622.1 phenylacetate-CoA oxygenase subunit PaaC [Chitinophagaceae bacterium]HNA91984.1 phenylacetate-CoA oxygenase subunit PaaC [Chitinophagaceae bacterium]HND96668.1 phenylacetate-CoA oxygenase subunit PaaC [Chitinophagaceae bacterium]HNJ57319.1 phenylacetate-CoA oxygenase subunit PaaC [Chitinophagaceae bacterium]